MYFRTNQQEEYIINRIYNINIDDKRVDDIEHVNTFKKNEGNFLKDFSKDRLTHLATVVIFLLYVSFFF